MFETIRYSIRQFLDDVKVLMTNDHQPYWEPVWPDYTPKDAEPHCECEDKVKDIGLYIEEWFDKGDRKVKYSVYETIWTHIKGNYQKYPRGTFCTLDEARWFIRNLKKYKKPIIHRY